MLDHRAADLPRQTTELILGKLDMAREPCVDVRHFLMTAAGEPLADLPAKIRSHLLAEFPELARIHGVEILDAVRLERLADWLKELFAVFLDERFEERQAEDFAFAFVD